MKVTYIHHSSFSVEREDVIFLFDYFNGENMDFGLSGHGLPEFDPTKRLFVFASHRHPDHFDLTVLKLAEKYPHIQFVFSWDIRLSENYLKKNHINPEVRDKICFMKPNEERILQGIRIETLLSTDAGVAFLVSSDDTTVYHAGDLNWWHWEGEEASFNLYQEEIYKAQIAKLKNREIKLAFVVMDGRLKEQKYWGIEYFMEQVNASYIIPMHLWNQYELIDEYRRKVKDKFPESRILEIDRLNQVIDMM